MRTTKMQAVSRDGVGITKKMVQVFSLLMMRGCINTNEFYYLRHRFEACYVRNGCMQSCNVNMGVYPTTRVLLNL